MQKFTHGNIKTYYQNEDGSVMATNESFYENPTALKREVTDKLKTSNDKFLSDVMQCLRLISSKKTQELTIVIKTDEYFMPRQITKTWTEDKEVMRNKR